MPTTTIEPVTQNPTGPCPYGHPHCEGVSGLYFGELSCWACYRDAPETATQAYTEAPA